VLLDAVLARLGPGAVRCGHRLVDVVADGASAGAELVFATADGPRRVAVDAVVGADGIHSAVRSALLGDGGPPHWNGSLIWRGATPFPTFLSGASMLILGGMEAKLVVYPIAPPDADGRVLTNWAVVRQVAADGDQPPTRESWSRTAAHAAVAQSLGHFSTDVIDPGALVEATEMIFEHPMCDRDPLPRWSAGPVTLLGDAAHSMYPVGSNGATQAIIDAACLAGQLSAAPVEDAFGRYEAIRRPATAQIVIDNRSGGPEGVIDDYERAHLPPLPRADRPA
jgi:2-polyprenyl-6-methoxyphenol hydroxylase-like FAD-dependent oxidoreductase